MKKSLILAILLGGCVAGPDVTVARLDPQAATAQETRAAKAWVTDSMKDPQSVRFYGIGAVTVSYKSGQSARVVCISADGKNSYGAYPGRYTRYFTNGVHKLPDHLAYAGDVEHLCEAMF